MIASRPNICKQLHMPAQSGSSSMLGRMRRGYSREAYDLLVAHVRGLLPGVALSTDMIVGFSGGWQGAGWQPAGDERAPPRRVFASCVPAAPRLCSRTG